MKRVACAAALVVLAAGLLAGWARLSAAVAEPSATPTGIDSPPRAGASPPSSAPLAAHPPTGPLGFNVRYLDEDGTLKGLDVRDFRR